jgi:hypothetical protein
MKVVKALLIKIIVMQDKIVIPASKGMALCLPYQHKMLKKRQSVFQ